MVSAIVLIQCEKNLVNQVAQSLTDIPGISEVYSVAGRVDLVAVIRVHTNDQLAEIVTNKMLKVAGVTQTETMIAFRAFSKFDLEQMFAIGFEEK